ncbi:DUF6338 family protein, partial [Marinococcus luteus]|uniref:DUF6338 family protein n=1 Tax=Marinococcus luteus TaxID=1122204 RepID=UPI002ACCBBAE
NINPIHQVPTAWDYIMHRSSWIIVTLQNDDRVYGYYSENSFASISNDGQDIFLEKIYEFDKDKREWIDDGRSLGIWIPHREIKYLEITFIEERKENNEEKQ